MPNERVVDVLLVSNELSVGAPPKLRKDAADEPVAEHLVIHPDLNLSIERNNPTFAKRVMTACESHNDLKFPGYGSAGGFYRQSPPGSEWDSDQVIRGALGIATLIQPHAIGMNYAARVATDGRSRNITLGPVQGYLAFRCLPSPVTERQWLTKADALGLATLFQTYWSVKTSLPQRIKIALWNYDYATFAVPFRPKFQLVSMALEGLVHTDMVGSTDQFCRVVEVAKLAGLTFSEEEARDAYDLRSTIAHGADWFSKLVTGPTLVVPPTKGKRSRGPYRHGYVAALLRKMDGVLRAALRKAIEDPTFRAIFTDDDSIRSRWPISAGRGKQRKGRRRP